MLFLALAEADRELGPPFVPVQVERHEGIALALHGAGEPVDFMAVQ